LHPTDLAHVRARPVSRAPILRLATAVLFLKTLFIDAAIRGTDDKTLSTDQVVQVRKRRTVSSAVLWPQPKVEASMIGGKNCWR